MNTITRYNRYILTGLLVGFLISVYSITSDLHGSQVAQVIEGEPTATSSEPIQEEIVPEEVIIPEPQMEDVATTTIEVEIEIATSTPSVLEEKATSTSEVLPFDLSTTTSPEISPLATTTATTTLETSTSTETNTSSTTESVATQTSGGETPAIEVTPPQPEPPLDDNWYPFTPRDCHTEEALVHFIHPGECMRMITR